MKSETIFARVSLEFKNKLQKLADKDKRTLSDYIRLVLEDHVQKEEEGKNG